MFMRALVGPLLLLTTLSGCHSTPPLMVDGFTLNPDPWLQDRQAILQRASFDISCDASQLTVRVLAVGGSNGSVFFDDWATQVGVTGCDQKVVYVRVREGWVANLAQTKQP